MVEGRDLANMVQAALRLATATIASQGADATREVRDERSTDISTRGDRAVSSALIEFFGRQSIPMVLLSEESGRIDIAPDPKFLVAFDDIDGTDNFFRGRDLLPYCTVVAVFEGAHPKYKDVLAAGIVEHRSGKLWLAERGKGMVVRSPGAGEAAAYASSRRALDRRSLVVVDQYSAKERIGELSRLTSLAWLKDFGSSALHLAGVASGIFDAFVNLRHKAHELGAGYLLIKEAGGTIVDVDGRPLDDASYEFEDLKGIVAAGTTEMADCILESLSSPHRQ